MSKQFDKLEEVFDLPNLAEAKGETIPSVEDVTIAIEHAYELEKEFNKINGRDEHDIEMDELANLAIKAHTDLQELGMNVEVKHAGEIFSSSSQMLKIAVDAKNNKIEKKLKMMKLQLEKMKLDRTLQDPNSSAVEGTAVTLDRNDILKQLRQMTSGDK